MANTIQLCLVVEVKIDDFGLWVTASIFEIVPLESRMIPLEEGVEGLLKNVVILQTGHL